MIKGEEEGGEEVAEALETMKRNNVGIHTTKEN